MNTAAESLPSAVLKPQRRISAAWIVPLLALLLAAWLGVRAWAARGVVVTVLLDEGHGIKAGDEVRYRGITVGEISAVELADDFGGIRVVAGLRSDGDRLARGGSRFWVVHPQLELSRIAGLETLVGPRYMAVLPGHGPPQRSFVGLREAPVVDAPQPGDLEVILEAAELGSLRRGAPVTYRQVRVGRVLSAGLTSDGGAVEARVHVDKAYAQLIRTGTRFWDVGGVDASVGLGGFSFEIQSLEAVLAGGVALATPSEAGDVVGTGHRFVIQSEAPSDWLQWQPMAVIGSSMLPPGARLPTPLRARVGWKQGWWIARNRSRQGWVLQTAEGLLGPADLLRPDEGADRETAVLEVAGQTLQLEPPDTVGDGRLAVLAVHVASPVWPAARVRAAPQPEDCLAIGDPISTPLPLAAARLEPGDGVWSVDPALSVDESLHGAAVVARRDGYLIGVLLVDDGRAEVALVDGLRP